MKKFINLSDTTDGQLESILRLASDLQQQPIREDLRGKTIGLVFMNPSLRTLASMETGVTQLGGHTFLIQPNAGSWKLETRTGAVMDGDSAEHVREAIPVLAQYADALAVRCFAEGKNLQADLADQTIQTMSSLCPKPFISLESAVAHPCQALADYKTLDDLEIPRRGGKFVLSWAWHPKPLAYAVPASALNMAVRRGMEVTILRPEGYSLPPPIMADALSLAARTGATIRETSQRKEAIEDAHVLYVKSWARPDLYGQVERELSARANLREQWCVRERWFENARPDTKLMHCLPVRRNVKIADEVLDGPRSVVIRQAGNRLHVQKALLLTMLREGL